MKAQQVRAVVVPGHEVTFFPTSGYEILQSNFDADISTSSVSAALIGSSNITFNNTISGYFEDVGYSNFTNYLSLIAEGSILETVTYTYTPASPPPTISNPIVSNGTLPSPPSGSPPTGGYNIITIPTMETLSITSTDLSAVGIENYGTLNQSGGNITLTGSLDQIANSQIVGNSTYTGGVYNLSGGNATMAGLTGNGIVNISGGSLTATTITHSGTINQTGGSLNSTTFTQNGSTGSDLYGNQTLSGVYNLSAGNASLGTITNNGIINQSGGNLTASSYTSTDSVYLQVSDGSAQHFGLLAVSGGSASLGNITGNGTITVTAGGSVTATTLSMPSGQVNVSNGTLTLSSTSATRQTSAVVIEIGNLTVGTAGKIDLANHDLIIHGGVTLSQVQTLIADAYDGGAWDGTHGITSSLITAGSGLALGYASAGELGISSFDGISVSSTDILIKFTYAGDANLDGMTYDDDEEIFAENFGASGDWSQGDFNYNGMVDSDDYNVYSNSYAYGTGLYGSGPGSGGPLVARVVPEPASLATLSLGTMLLLKRRRLMKSC